MTPDDIATPYEAPTVEGRALVNLGRQMATLRAALEAERATVARLQEALKAVRSGIEGDMYRATLTGIIDATLGAGQ